MSPLNCAYSSTSIMPQELKEIGAKINSFRKLLIIVLVEVGSPLLGLYGLSSLILTSSFSSTQPSLRSAGFGPKVLNLSQRRVEGNRISVVTRL